MSKQKQELAVIDFEKFSIAQLPELQGKKEEIASVIKANPIVKIVDNSTYELAKKSRTAVKTLRTGLEKEQKDVKKKIKEFVLDVVDGEYSNLVTDVKSAEKQRQDPIDVWEEKKEQERLEKLRLEQERIDGIKGKISLFFTDWSSRIGSLQFANLENLSTEFTDAIEKYDKKELQEFEVLFVDAVSNLTYMFSEKKANLVAQEQIRIDNLLIQEKNAENYRIQDWQRVWNTNIDTLSFDDLKDVKSVLVKSKLADLKHYSNEYEEIYTSTEKRLHSQIELISKAEEQRIAQEKFLAEKKEFEEKQSEAKFQERKKFLVDEDYYRIYFIGECNEEENVFKSKLLAFSDSEFEDFKLAVLKAKEPIISETIETYNGINHTRILEDEKPNLSNEDLKKAFESATPKLENYHEADVDEKGVVKTHEESAPIIYKSFGDQSEKVLENIENKTHEFANYQEEVQHIEQIPTKSEVTWEEIHDTFVENTQIDDSINFFYWLKDNYNVPTKKQ